MKLTQDNKELLKSWGHGEQDILQIQEATRKTVYELNDKRITTKRAIELLGLEEYLSGISRSAFHYTSARQILNGDDVIIFDSSKLFE